MSRPSGGASWLGVWVGVGSGKGGGHGWLSKVFIRMCHMSLDVDLELKTLVEKKRPLLRTSLGLPLCFSQPHIPC